MTKLTLNRVFVLSLLCSVTIAAPVIDFIDGIAHLKRGNGESGQPGTKDNPKDATFDVTDWPDLAEQDCYAMLCLGKGTVL